MESICRVHQGSEFLDLPERYYTVILKALAEAGGDAFVQVELLGDNALALLRLSTIDSLAVLTEQGTRYRAELAKEWDRVNEGKLPWENE